MKQTNSQDSTLNCSRVSVVSSCTAFTRPMECVRPSVRPTVESTVFFGAFNGQSDSYERRSCCTWSGQRYYWETNIAANPRTRPDARRAENSDERVSTLRKVLGLQLRLRLSRRHTVLRSTTVPNLAFSSKQLDDVTSGARHHYIRTFGTVAKGNVLFVSNSRRMKMHRPIILILYSHACGANYFAAMRPSPNYRWDRDKCNARSRMRRWSNVDCSLGIHCTNAVT